jgi:hypothetical protein
MFKPDYIKNKLHNICNTHYFQDLYTSKKLKALKE